VRSLPLLAALALALAAPVLRAESDSDEIQRGLEFKHVDAPPAAPAKVDSELEDLANQQLDKLSGELKLDDKQKAKIRPLLVKKLEKLQELRKELHSAEQKADESVRDLLTDDQKERFDAMRVASRQAQDSKQ
jgi:hypothetical protein